MSLAPIALFAFKRPEHTKRALEALSRNREFDQSPLFIFCDGTRHEREADAVVKTRKIVRDFPHSDKRIFESVSNLGLAKSIADGVGNLCKQFGCVIVVEDDLLVAAGFLAFMNGALRRYASDQNVMQIAGHMYPVDLGVRQDAVFLPVITSWGWATWRRAWPNNLQNQSSAEKILSSVKMRFDFDFEGGYPYSRMLSDQIAGKNSSWAIWFYAHIFMANGLILFPTESLVDNRGFDGSGENCIERETITYNLTNKTSWLFPNVEISRIAASRMRRFFIRDRGTLRFVKDNFWRLRGHGKVSPVKVYPS